MPQRTQRPCRKCGRLHPGSECPQYPSQQRTLKPDTRPSAARRGYDREWREVTRPSFLSRNPFCEDCGEPATHADHVPRRHILIELGIDDPDADIYLHPRCHSCHSSKTAREDGAFGNPKTGGSQKSFNHRV